MLGGSSIRGVVVIYRLGEWGERGLSEREVVIDCGLGWWRVKGLSLTFFVVLSEVCSRLVIIYGCC